MTIDYPSRYVEGKVPMLNLKIWIQEIDGRYVLLYEHYEKEMTTKAVIHASSAIPYKMKRTVLTQEVLRILLHCSNDLTWETVLVHLNGFMRKMQYSGYDKTFRYTVAKSVINAYETIRENERIGLRPMHRPKRGGDQKESWRKRRRRSLGTNEAGSTLFSLSLQRQMES